TNRGWTKATHWVEVLCRGEDEKGPDPRLLKGIEAGPSVLPQGFEDIGEGFPGGCRA
ncbi:hypothetical protein BHE74_00055489, partial [Ensete ventricosum]